MDGWSRPNHMPSRLDALRTTTSVALRRLVGKSQSVAKQASSDVASGRDFKGFRKDFGRFWEAKTEAKIDVSEVFFDVFFERVFASIFCGFWEARNMKNQ